jgi:hypothetical protein
MSISHDATLNMADILDRTFRIYRAHFLRLAAIAAIAGVPALAAQGLLSRALTAGTPIAWIWLISFGQGLVVALLLGSLAAGALTAAVARAYHDEPLAIGGAYGVALRRYPVLLVAALVPVTIERLMGLIVSLLQTPLSTMAISGGAPDLDSTGLYIVLGTLLGTPVTLVLLLIYSQLFLYAPVAVLEQRGPLDALVRSWALLAGGRWRGLLVALITRLISYLLGSLPWLAFTFVFFRLSTNYSLLTAGTLTVGLLSMLIATPLVQTIHTVFYYALRDHREGYDIERNLPQITAEEAA